MSELLAVGLNHKSAPVELRERLAIGDDDHALILEQLQRRMGLAELMVVSTCNRVELYAVAPEPEVARAALVELAALRQVETAAVEEHVFVRAAGDAARHIFRVAASLESLVVGEPQILGQVKDAYTKAKETGVVGPVLDRCMSMAFHSAKRVRTETEIARGAASVPSVAVDLAVSIFGDLSDCAVLLVGAGEMAEQAAIHLDAAGVPEIIVINRSEERGRTLATKVGGHYEGWHRLEAQLARADVVVTSTGSKDPVIVAPMLKPVMRARRQRPLFFVDIAVPRDVEPAVARLNHVFLYNVDDLQSIVHDNMRVRQTEADRAASVVDEEVQGFLQWMRSRSIGPLIGQLQKHGRSIVEAEVQKALARLPELPDQQRAVVEQLASSVMQKLLHKPMANVRKATASPQHGFDGTTLAEALATLFELEARVTLAPTQAEDDPDERSDSSEPHRVSAPEAS